VVAAGVDMRRPVRSGTALFRSKSWTIGWVVSVPGARFHVVALALAPLALGRSSVERPSPPSITAGPRSLALSLPEDRAAHRRPGVEVDRFYEAGIAYMRDHLAEGGDPGRRRGLHARQGLPDRHPQG
jgi:hypothetical protein